MRTVCLIFTFFFSTLASAEVRLENGWVRLPPPNAQAVGAYGKLVNSGEEPMEVTDARAAGFERGMLHETYLGEDGMTRMEHLDRIELPPGGFFSLQPGRAHIMLMRPEEALKEGQTVTVELEVDGEWQAYDLIVRRD